MKLLGCRCAPNQSENLKVKKATMANAAAVAAVVALSCAAFFLLSRYALPIADSDYGAAFPNTKLFSSASQSKIDQKQDPRLLFVYRMKGEAKMRKNYEEIKKIYEEMQKVIEKTLFQFYSESKAKKNSFYPHKKSSHIEKRIDCLDDSPCLIDDANCIKKLGEKMLGATALISTNSISKASERICATKLLGFNKEPGKKECRQGFRELGLKYHPDRNHGANKEELFRLISHAYDMICK